MRLLRYRPVRLVYDFYWLCRTWWYTLDGCAKGVVTMHAAQLAHMLERREDFPHGAESRTWWYPDAHDCHCGFIAPLDAKDEPVRPANSPTCGTAGSGEAQTFMFDFSKP